VAIEFFDNEVGRRVAFLFQAMMKVGTVVINPLHYESFLYPDNPEEMKVFLEQKYAQTKKIWSEEEI
jgi:hypothetical protein